MATNAAVSFAPESRPFRIRELSIGAVMDQALEFVRERFWALTLTSLAVTFVPVSVALGYGVIPAAEMWAEFVGGEQMMQPAAARELLLHIGAVTIPLAFLAYRIAEPIALGALIVLVAGTIMGKQPTVGEALKRSLRHTWPLVSMWFLRWVCVQIGSLACYVPGLLLAGLFSVAAPAILLERKGPMAALGRSIELNKQRMLPSLLLILLLGFIEWMMTQLCQVLPGRVLQSAAMGIVYSGTLSLYAAAITVHYFSGRCKVENLDLQLLAEQVVAAPEDADSPEERTLFSPAP